MEETKRQTCLKLQFRNNKNNTGECIFVKGSWFDTHFHIHLDITDGFTAMQPSSLYAFADAADDHKRFLGVLNSKKAKMRELRDQLSEQENAKKSPQEEDTDKTESFDEESDFEFDKSDDESLKCITSSLKSLFAPWIFSEIS